MAKNTIGRSFTYGVETQEARYCYGFIAGVTIYYYCGNQHYTPFSQGFYSALAYKKISIPKYDSILKIYHRLSIMLDVPKNCKLRIFKVELKNGGFERTEVTDSFLLKQKLNII